MDRIKENKVARVDQIWINNIKAAIWLWCGTTYQKIRRFLNWITTVLADRNKIEFVAYNYFYYFQLISQKQNATELNCDLVQWTQLEKASAPLNWTVNQNWEKRLQQARLRWP